MDAVPGRRGELDCPAHRRLPPAPLRHSDWTYKGEGNANIVVAYVGADTSENGGLVVRLRKRAVPNAADSRDPDARHACAADGLQESAGYADEVIGELLGKPRVGYCERVPVTPGFLEKLADRIRPARPAKRLHRDVDRSATWATLCADHTVFSRHGREPTVSVEIKPKWGFLPSSRFIDPDRAPPKSATCRFCMHQALKYPDDPARRSAYCPMDLFSDDEGRMRKAVEDLQLTPQSNFRLYVNGEAVPPGAATFDRIAHFFSEDGVGGGEGSDRTRHHLCALIVSILRRERALEDLRELQRTLDELDIEGIAKVCGRWSDDPRFAEFLSREPSRDEWARTVREYKSRDADGRRRRRRRRGDGGDLCGMTLEEALQSVREYLICATLKDCSVFISVQRTESAGSALRPSSSPEGATTATLAQLLEGPTSEVDLPLGAGRTVRYRYKLRFVDLDAKSVRKIPEYAELDRRIVENWVRVGGNKVCRGGP